MERPHSWLGYLNLREGNIPEAERQFLAVIEPFNSDAKLRVEIAKEKFPTTGLIYGWIWKIKPIGRVLRRWLDPWFKRWDHLRALLYGGNVYQAAQAWQCFEERLEAFEKAKQEKNDRPNIFIIEKAFFESYIEGFSVIPGIEERVRIAASFETGSGKTPSDARKFLGELLSVQEVEALDRNLFFAEVKLTVAQADDNASAKEASNILGQTKEMLLVRALFSDSWKKVKQSLEVKNFDECEALLQEFRDETREPDEAKALKEFLLLGLADAGRRGLKEKAARTFLPAFKLMDEWRATFRNGFFLEGEYYLALARYRTFTKAEMTKARMQAERLHASFLTGAIPRGLDKRRYKKLRILAQCLEVNAALRILMLEQSIDTFNIRMRLDALMKDIIPRLRGIANAEKHDGTVREAAYCTLGLLERHERKQKLAPASGIKIGWPVPLEITERLRREIGYFQSALRLEPSADTYFYLAETLNEVSRKDEAKAFNEQALKLCPQHAGALALQAQCAPKEKAEVT